MFAGVIYTSLHREKLLRLLKAHLFSHIVRMRNTDSAVALTHPDQHASQPAEMGRDIKNYLYYTQV